MKTTEEIIELMELLEQKNLRDEEKAIEENYLNGYDGTCEHCKANIYNDIINWIKEDE